MTWPASTCHLPSTWLIQRVGGVVGGCVVMALGLWGEGGRGGSFQEFLDVKPSQERHANRIEPRL